MVLKMNKYIATIISLMALILFSGCSDSETRQEKIDNDIFESVYHPYEEFGVVEIVPRITHVKYTEEYLETIGGSINDTFIILDYGVDLYLIKNVNDNTSGFTQKLINKQWLYEIEFEVEETIVVDKFVSLFWTPIFENVLTNESHSKVFGLGEIYFQESLNNKFLSYMNLTGSCNDILADHVAIVGECYDLELSQIGLDVLTDESLGKYMRYKLNQNKEFIVSVE